LVAITMYMYSWASLLSYMGMHICIFVELMILEYHF
jgi:hypothetical protein